MKTGFSWQMQVRSSFNDGSPRRTNVVYAMEVEGLLNKWVFRGHLKELLSRYKATQNASCWDIINREHGVGTASKSGALRYVLESLGRPLDPKMAVLEVSARSVADYRRVALELGLGLGAYGATVELYPIPKFGPNLILVNVSDLMALTEFASGIGRSLKSTAIHGVYGYVVVHSDDFVGDYLTSQQANLKLNEGPKTPKQHPHSNFLTRAPEVTIESMKKQLDVLKSLLARGSD